MSRLKDGQNCLCPRGQSGQNPEEGHSGGRGRGLRPVQQRRCKGGKCDKKCGKRKRQHQVTPSLLPTTQDFGFYCNFMGSCCKILNRGMM